MLLTPADLCRVCLPHSSPDGISKAGRDVRLVLTWFVAKTERGQSTGLEGLRDEYEKRRDVMIDNLHRGFTTQDDQVFVSERSPDYLHISTTSPLASFDTRK